jgi:hypothetical protein
MSNNFRSLALSFSRATIKSKGKEDSEDRKQNIRKSGNRPLRGVFIALPRRAKPPEKESRADYLRPTKKRPFAKKCEGSFGF